MTATVAYLSGARHDSKRGVEEVVETVFGVPVALGSIVAAEAEMTAALAPAHAEAVATVRQAPAKYVDENSWKQAGDLRWLWAAVAGSVACFVVHVTRGAAGFEALLGDVVSGIVCNDRWRVYDQFGRYRRQLCWAHLRRDFRTMVDRGGRRGRHGVAGVYRGRFHVVAPGPRRNAGAVEFANDHQQPTAVAACPVGTR